MARDPPPPPSSAASEKSLAPQTAAAQTPEAAESQTKTPAAASSALPLRPTLRDRYDHFVLRLLPAPYYFHPQLTRFRLSLLLIALILLILLLSILLPVLHHKSHGASSVPLPTGAKTYTGDGTYYAPGLGACGITSTDKDMIVAIAWQLFDSKGGPNPNLNPFCGRKIRAKRIGKSTGVEVTVVDRCTGCKPQDLDFSPGAFKGIAEEWEGRVGIEWAWV
ncbi:hypothetical protein K440DRAFT_615091 [Wilcoxina mikolae CBS 423.85]|nr:hypothetical protein K440DRAFT_615091 [Wilcoxina mikolae CBS 423.85]